MDKQKNKTLFRRIAAFFIDMIIMTLPIFLIFYFFINDFYTNSSSLIEIFFSTVVFLIYHGLSNSLFKGTLGKKIFNLKVLTTDGTKLSITNSILRSLCISLVFLPTQFYKNEYLILLLHAINAGIVTAFLSLLIFRPDRRTVHDLIFHTCVVDDKFSLSAQSVENRLKRWQYLLVFFFAAFVFAWFSFFDSRLYKLFIPEELKTAVVLKNEDSIFKKTISNFSDEILGIDVNDSGRDIVLSFPKGALIFDFDYKLKTEIDFKYKHSIFDALQILFLDARIKSTTPVLFNDEYFFLVYDDPTTTAIVLNSNGNEIFRYKMSIFASPGSIYIADLNFDNKLDIFVTNRGSSIFHIAYQDGEVIEKILDQYFLTTKLIYEKDSESYKIMQSNFKGRLQIRDMDGKCLKSKDFPFMLEYFSRIDSDNEKLSFIAWNNRSINPFIFSPYTDEILEYDIKYDIADGHTTKLLRGAYLNNKDGEKIFVLLVGHYFFDRTTIYVFKNEAIIYKEIVDAYCGIFNSKRNSNSESLLLGCGAALYEYNLK